MGLPRKSLNPASRQACRSCSALWPVKAISCRLTEIDGTSRIAFAALKPSIWGISRSMMTASNGPAGSVRSRTRASTPFAASITRWPRLSSRARVTRRLAWESSTTSSVFADQGASVSSALSVVVTNSALPWPPSSPALLGTDLSRRLGACVGRSSVQTNPRSESESKWHWPPIASAMALDRLRPSQRVGSSNIVGVEASLDQGSRLLNRSKSAALT